MDWITDLEGMSLIVTADQERWKCDLSPSAELEVQRRDDEEDRFDAFCFFGEFSDATEFPPEVWEEFTGRDLDCNGIQAVITLTDVSDAEIVEFLEQHLDFIQKTFQSSIPGMCRSESPLQVAMAKARGNEEGWFSKNRIL